MTLGIGRAQEYTGISMLINIMKPMPRLNNGQQVDHKCKHMTFGISKLNNVFLLHIKCKTIISSTPMCYTKCYNAMNYSLQKVTYPDKECHIEN